MFKLFRRILTLLTAACLLLPLLPAAAEAPMPDALYRIVLRTESGDVTLGTGVVYGSETTLLTAAGCWAEGDLYAIGADGEHAILRTDAVTGTQLVSMALATPASAEPMEITTTDSLLDYLLYGVNAQGEFVCMDVWGSRVTRVDGRTEALLYAAEGLMPGAIMMGDDFGLACVTVFQAAEGEGAYAAVTDVTLSRLVSRPAEGAWLLTGFTASYEAGLITVDWSSAPIPVAENTAVTVYAAGTNNNYLSSVDADEGETTASFPAAPGTEVMTWIVVSQGTEDAQLMPETMDEVVFVQVPGAEPITLNGMRNVRMAVTSGEPGLDGVASDFLPQEPLTRENLSDRSRSIYFMTEDVYTCDAEDDDHTLMVTLYTPEGYTMSYFSGYVFMPEYTASDLWVTDISDVFADYERFCGGEPWPAGEYTILYTVDGAEVARMTFTLD
ncbi:MAG: hypothetical protein IKK57_01850 [Clostridia bacterium]|nr:hypothetical protein [Clostridia bacterium]